MKAAADQAVLMKGQKTRTAILNVAERLFGQGNFDSVSLRNVAEQAEVPLGLINYHFGSKEALFEAAATRWAEESNQARLDALRAYEAPTVEQIFDAFLRPVLIERSGPEWRNYLNIVAQIGHEERWNDMNKRLFQATAQEFFVALQRTRPDIPRDALAHGFLYALFVLFGSVRDRPKVEDLGAAGVHPDDMSRVLETVIPFVAGGIERLAAASVPAEPAPLPA